MDPGYCPAPGEKWYIEGETPSTGNGGISNEDDRAHVETMTRHRTEAGTFAAKREPGEPLSREELAGMLSDVLKKLHARATAPRFVEKQTDQGLMSLVRAFTQTATALNGVIRDRDLDELERRIAELEAANETTERQRETSHRSW